LEADFLESSFEVMLVNAQHIKAVPGRKLMSKMLNGLLNYCNMDSLRPSFIPQLSSETWDLTRYRTSFIRAG